MILMKLSVLNSLKSTHIYQTSKCFKNISTRFKLMSEEKESLLQAETKHSIELKTLATDVSLKIIGSGARGTPASVCLYTNESRYIFNCGESTQRVNNEHRNKLCKLSKIDNVFITTPSWKNIGGLPGFLLCLQTYGVNNVNIHGPIGTVDIVDATRRFVYLKRLTVVEANIRKPFIDNVLTINYVPLEIKDTNYDIDDVSTDSAEIEDSIDYYAHEISKSEKRKAIIYGNNVKRVKRESNSVKGRNKNSMCYIGKIHPRIGRLNLEKCVEKGIQPGPMLGQLKNGKDVTLSDGTLIRSSDVVDPPNPGPVFIVADCPRAELLESLTQNPLFEKHQAATATSKDMIPLCVIHFTPESILRNEKYKLWMEKFGWSTQHIIVNEFNTCLGTEAVHKIQHQFHLLHDKIFPFLDESHIPIVKLQKTDILNESFNNTSTTEVKTGSSVLSTINRPLIHRAKTLHSFSLVPYNGLNVTREIKLYPQEYLDEIFEMKGFLDALAEVQTNVNSVQKQLNEIPEYPKLIILGTSSTANTKIRNTSSLLLRIDKDTSIMMDCGEGTINQIFRIFGKETDNILTTIKAIYISHLHADHQLGLIGVLQERSRSTEQPVYLLAPERILSWLHFFDSRYECISKTYILISNSKFLNSDHEITAEIQERLYNTLKAKDISTVTVNHCAFSYGISITLANNQKIVYSGDTMPCVNLVKLGHNCDLLIHEATFGDEHTEAANRKLHSTVSQAIEIGEKMKAKFTLLTHFSQRFAKTFYMPEISEQSDCSKIGMAFDNMHIRLAELPILPLFYPCLEIMCYEICDVTDFDGKKIVKKLKTSLRREIDKLE